MSVPAGSPQAAQLPRPDWPNRAASRIIEAGGLRFHVQEMAPAAAGTTRDEPAILLVHGTGASTHSFRDILPRAASVRRTIAVDLPGHGFTQGGHSASLTLRGMARALAALVPKLELDAWSGAGHSAGAAILLQMVLEGTAVPRSVTGINAALEPIRGNTLLSPLAKLLFHNPLTAHAVAFQARFSRLPERLLDATASQIDARGLACYGELLRDTGHISGALGMMANWDLEPLAAAFSRIAVPVHLIAAADDPMVPARVSQDAARRLPHGRVTLVPKGGHLWHEAFPQAATDLILGQPSAARITPAA